MHFQIFLIQTAGNKLELSFLEVCIWGPVVMINIINWLNQLNCFRWMLTWQTRLIILTQFNWRWKPPDYPSLRHVSLPKAKTHCLRRRSMPVGYINLLVQNQNCKARGKFFKYLETLNNFLFKLVESEIGKNEASDFKLNSFLNQNF